MKTSDGMEYRPKDVTVQAGSAVRRRWLMFMLFVITTFNFIDRIVFLTLGQPIKQDLGLTDLQLGILGGVSFAIFYSFVGFPIARLAERTSRVRLIAASVALWSLMTTLCGATGSMVQLLLCRIGGSIGEAGVQPAAMSLVADQYPPSRRGGALTVISLGMPLGLIIGSTAGGWMAQALSWRMAFFIVGGPGVVLAFVTWLTLREPVRGQFDSPQSRETTDQPPSVMQVLRVMTSRSSCRNFMLALGLTSIGAQGIGAFMFPYFVRVLHLPLAEAGLMFGTIGGMAMGFGMMFGGFGVDWISRRDGRWYGWVPAIGLSLAAPLYLVAFIGNDVTVSLVALTLGGMFVFMHFGPTIAVLQNMVGSRMRATAAFLFFFISNLVGMGIGPVSIGFFSDVLARRAFPSGNYIEMCPGGLAPAGSASGLAQACQHASAVGLQQAMAGCACFLMLGMIFYLRATRSVRRDLALDFPQSSEMATGTLHRAFPLK
ncbi:MFS transporter [Caballeronia novacaledonica]|uniref:MFS transporter n=1 Tax=Caballeronia novacaledonica TaxID=1544861 RepID=A0ACB5R6D9_9BURK|nr:MFS transporter [Caballeronia sp. LZ029]MDR5748872.1 MFS transporter [Caballeronia sp. LZ029]GJH22552.1 MFS transporter [Caballeronia novacaledonica]